MISVADGKIEKKKKKKKELLDEGSRRGFLKYFLDASSGARSSGAIAERSPPFESG